MASSSGKPQARHPVGPAVNLRRDDHGASPLVVLTTFVVVAVLVTIAIYALVVDKPEPALALSPKRGGDGLSFQVTHAAGGLAWSEIEVRFTDRAGVDVAATYLHVPTGGVQEDDVIGVAPQPPAGTYLLQAYQDGDELVRLSVTL